MTPADFAWAFNNVGFPGILCVMLWRVLVFCKPIVTNEIIPMFRKIGTGHIEFMNTTSTAITKMLSNQEEFANRMEEIHSTVIRLDKINTAKQTKD